MTPREFLQANIDVIDKALLKKAASDLDKLSNDAWVKKYFKDFSSNKDTALDFRNLINYKPLPERLRASFGDMGYNPNDVWKKAIYQTEYSDVPLEEFESALANMKKYYDYETKLQDETKALNERKKEVKDWGWRDFIASDYEKQRYLEDPKSALFGKQAPEIGEAPETRWGSIGDLGAGVAATATDFATARFPIINAVAGPSIRLGRDIAHKVSGSPYQKDWKDIGSNYLSDIMINGGASVLPNARQASRVAGGLLPGSTNKQFQALVDAKESAKALKELPPTTNTWDFVNAVDNLEESSLKQDLLKTISPNGKVDVAEANSIRKNYGTALDKEYFNELRTHTPGYYETAVPTTPADYLRYPILKDAGNTTIARRLGIAGTPKTRIETISLRGLNLMDKLNKGSLGTRVVEGLANVTGRGSTPNVIETEERIEDFNRKKEAMKSQLGESWLKYGRAFAPKKKPGDPAYEAYVEVTGDTLD